MLFGEINVDGILSLLSSGLWLGVFATVGILLGEYVGTGIVNNGKPITVTPKIKKRRTLLWSTLFALSFAIFATEIL